jgi:benzoylformate decarboxylase
LLDGAENNEHHCSYSQEGHNDVREQPGELTLPDPVKSESKVITAAEAAVEVLAANGVEVVFSNPGTTEIPFIKHLTDARSPLRYVLTLHEGAAVSGAIGHALATGRPGVALVHAMPGLANALSMYFDALKSGVPLVLIVGQQDRRHQYLDPLLQAEMTDVTRSISKHVWEVRTAAEVPDVIERALHAARMPPAGPILLSIPLDVWDEPVTLQDRRPVDSRSELGTASATGIAALAEAIVSAESPVIVAGDLVGMRRCASELLELADAAGAPVFWPPGAVLANFPTTSAYHAGHIFHNTPAFDRAFGHSDLAVLVGAELQGPLLFSGADVLPAGCRLMSLTETPADPTGAFSVELALYGDLAASIAAVSAEVRKIADGSERAGQLEARRQSVQERGASARERLRARAVPAEGNPLSGPAAIATILGAAPKDVAVIDESVSNAWVSLLGEFDDELGYIAPGRGGALGYAVGAAAGVKIALPDRPVLAIVGDGATLYGIHALWTLAHEKLPVVVCVLNNSGYTILKDFLRSDRFSPELSGSDNADAELSAGLANLSIADPPIDMVVLARAYGLDAVGVTDADAVRIAVERAFASNRPWLIDVSIA